MRGKVLGGCSGERRLHKQLIIYRCLILSTLCDFTKKNLLDYFFIN